ncbi:TIGR03364 family FAD-dependent oxidoreductase [uncultured Corynebacterium sp.]|uniref:TIGR03364 family FAD-dependent oxidoreductase n=1 Tax=uncultured Corynebacterium sp. TaxID=159447 RepID=UPI0025FCC434|nr:TIGR03364 family FAD-dependent oxidoreductase [uncultured Corynebacterium sp.]
MFRPAEKTLSHHNGVGNKADLIVVGAGIVGLATAWRAHHQGRRVHVIDRTSRPVGASIQNFGHACFTAQADAIQEVAADSRDGWKAAAVETGLWAAQSGTIVPAVSETEMTVLRQLYDHRGSEQITLLSADNTRERLGLTGFESSGTGDIIGGALLPLDMRVNPREATPCLAEWLAANGVEFSWDTAVHHVGDGQVDTSRGRFSADEVVVCPGHHVGDIFPDIAECNGLRTCILTMALIDRPDHIPADLAMLTGTSLARYDGVAAMPGVPDLREELLDTKPELVGCIANLMATALPDGAIPGLNSSGSGIFIGDSHDYAQSPEPFIQQSIADLLMDNASAYLGIEQPVVRQRWQGRYADSPDTNLVLEWPDDRTTVAVVASGIGMTLSFGIATLITEHRDAPDF